jgi:hypothetical protein
MNSEQRQRDDLHADPDYPLQEAGDETGSLALFAAPHRGWQLRRTRLQSLPTVNKPTLIKDISGAGALHPMSAAPAVSMSVRGRPRFPLRVLGNPIRESQ